MSIIEAFRLAFKNIITSKMRTFLTMLGIIIGVGAVIVIIGLGNGLELYVSDSFESLGTDTLTVTVRSRSSTRQLDADDMYRMVDENSDYLKACSPVAYVGGFLKIGTETLSDTSISGVGEDYLEMSGLNIAQGRGLYYSDIALRSKVCVIGEYLNRTYFGGRAVGETVRVGSEAFTIIGVVERQTDEDEKLASTGEDNFLYLPYSTAQRMNGAISSYKISVVDEDEAEQAKDALESSLYDFFGDDDYYTVISMSEILDMMTSMIDIMVGVLAGIAAISLVVGGIGIMNIMLVSVTERTCEIGIRKSLGAKERYILEQFVIEAASTSALGGVIGIGFGYLLSRLASVLIAALLQATLTVTPTAGAIALAFGISVGIGILFGYLPAQKAARLNPIDALHYE